MRPFLILGMALICIWGLLGIYRGLLVIYRGLLVIYRGLLVIYRGLLVIYRGLLGIYRGLLVIPSDSVGYKTPSVAVDNLWITCG